MLSRARKNTLKILLTMLKRYSVIHKVDSKKRREKKIKNPNQLKHKSHDRLIVIDIRSNNDSIFLINVNSINIAV